jgi:hypothetical protein
MKQCKFLFVLLYLVGSCSKEPGRDEPTPESKEPQQNLIRARVLTTLRLNLSAESVAENENCKISSGAGLVLGEAPQPEKDQFFKVNLKQALPGCESTSGYVYGPDFGLQAAFGFTPLQEFMKPLVAQKITSEWCQCRDEMEGLSSPHIGVDLVSDLNPMNSIAMSNGRVESVNLVSESCGYEVFFLDSAGARWRFLHLDKPNLIPGQAVAKGEIMGLHSSYPKQIPGTKPCGLGAHLHIERHSAGGFGGEAAEKTCRSGRRLCRFDPQAPLEKMTPLGSELERERVAGLSRMASLSLLDPESTLIPLTFTCNVSQPTPVPVLKVTEPSLDSGGLALEHKVIFKDYGINKYSFSVSNFLKGNPENICDEGKAKECIVRWELQFKDSEERWLRAFADQSVRNVEMRVSLESHFCMPKTTSPEYKIVALTNQNRVLVSSGIAIIDK